MSQAITDAHIMQGLNVNPEKVALDFEKSQMHAVKTFMVMTFVTLGCFYHLTKAILRKIQNLDLTVLYK